MCGGGEPARGLAGGLSLNEEGPQATLIARMSGGAHSGPLSSMSEPASLTAGGSRAFAKPLKKPWCGRRGSNPHSLAAEGF